MSIYEVTPNSLEALQPTDFAREGLRERTDLQRLIRDKIEVLDAALLVIGEEFGDWEDSNRRIDLLAIDREANLVVIELKRTESGGHMELQALRYAAMVSTMTFDKARDIYRAHLQEMGRDDDPESSLLEFLGWDEPDEGRFALDVRVILASADFSKELTTTVMWLNQRGLDIRCVRLQPYSDGDRVLLDVQQVIPLPETAEFQIQLREKVQREKQTRSIGPYRTRYDVEVLGEKYQNVSKRVAIFRVIQALVRSGRSPEEISSKVDDKFYKRRLRVAEGDLDEKDFSKAVKGLNGFIVRDNELMHHDGRTYAISWHWGGESWHAAMRALAESYEIRFSPTESVD